MTGTQLSHHWPKEPIMKCPTCPDVTLSMTNREGIEIDYCPTCRGVWLDRGELDKIIERSMGSPSQIGEAPQAVDPRIDPRTDPRYAQGGYRKYDDDDDHYKHQGRYYGKKRRGLLGDLFDFD
jgi:Zn-finger nucleic acid-binding protein